MKKGQRKKKNPTQEKYPQNDETIKIYYDSFNLLSQNNIIHIAQAIRWQGRKKRQSIMSYADGFFFHSVNPLT